MRERNAEVATSELIEALQALAHERKIDELYLIDRLEASLAKSYQHILDLEWDARVTIDRQTGKIKVMSLGPLFAQTIQNVYANGSVAKLFE